MLLEVRLQDDLHRLARFGANIANCYSCFIFLPEAACHSDASAIRARKGLLLTGYHSLDEAVVYPLRVPIDKGVIGWISNNRRVVQISPIESNSPTNPAYKVSPDLGSFSGVPIIFDNPSNGQESVGVLACDSKRTKAFSEFQTRLLADLAIEIGSIITLSTTHLQHKEHSCTWDDFITKGKTLVSGLGRNAVEVLRIRPLNLDQIELTCGTEHSCKLLSQLHRLLNQALPAHFALYRLGNGEVVIILDNMMTSYYENKIRALAEHLNGSRQALILEFSRVSFRSKQHRTSTLEALIAATSCGGRDAVITLSDKSKVRNEYR